MKWDIPQKDSILGELEEVHLVTERSDLGAENPSIFEQPRATPDWTIVCQDYVLLKTCVVAA